jgi:Tfp pilus assembly protein PilO
MMFLKEKQQIIILCLAAAMLGGFVLFRYLPLSRKIKAVEQTKAAQRLVITQAQYQREQLPAMRKQLPQLQKTLENYSANIPSQRNLGTFLHRIADLMDEHKLKEQSAQPGEELQVGDLKCIPIDIRCKGKLTQVFKFYKSLQNLDRLVQIEQVKLVNDSDFSGEVSLQTKAIIYYKLQAEQG